jgi:formamidopyrimidine-DNA glycosylase
MPELPDIVLYLTALESRILDARLERIRLTSPFLLRSTDPPPGALEGRSVRAVSRLGKRIVIGVDGALFAVLHLMVAGRLHWKAAGAPLARRRDLAAFDFTTGTLTLTEAGTTHRAALYLARGRAALAALDAGGLDVLEADLAAFMAAVRRENHTLKRALTDPRLVSGIGNAYSDEILHAARLSPVALTSRLDDAEIARLYHATRTVVSSWIERLRAQAGEAFPERVTAFRPEMAVHGRYRQPCPTCGAPVQRIRYAENEVNYCARCQTGGRVLADRAFSRLLRDDWPRSLDAWEERFPGRGGGPAGGDAVIT